MNDISGLHHLVVIFGIVALVALVAGKGVMARLRGEDFMGTPPVAKWMFISGKAASFFNWLFLAYRAASLSGESAFSVHWLFSWAGATLFAAAVLLVGASFVHLGASNKMGLPEEEATLRTEGVYRFSRNPMYLGFAMISAASAIYYPNPVNIACAFVSIAVHHAILLSEEHFLAGCFVERWDEYARRTPRYFLFRNRT